MEFADDSFDVDKIQVKITFEFEQFLQEPSSLPITLFRFRNIVGGINVRFFLY